MGAPWLACLGLCACLGQITVAKGGDYLWPSLGVRLTTPVAQGRSEQRQGHSHYICNNGIKIIKGDRRGILLQVPL